LKIGWTAKLIVTLAAISGVCYGINYLVFKDIPYMLRLITLQVGFVPVSVVLITLWINRLISQRENKHRLQKLNIVIGNFFMELGTPLLDYLAAFDTSRDAISKILLVTPNWSDQDFAAAKNMLRDHHYAIAAVPEDLEALRTLLNSKRSFLMLILENPSLLEREEFTDLLSAIAHLTEELARRTDLTRLGQADYEHIAVDIKRAYTLLLPVWLDYMKHIKNDYPYLYSLAVRINPFNPQADPEVK